MKYKVGQTVRVKEHKMGRCRIEGCMNLISDMEKYIGKKLKVEEVLEDYYSLKEKEQWWWSDCMLEPVKKRGRPKKTLSKKQIDIKEIEITLLKFESKRLSLEDTVEEILKIYE